MSNFFFGFTLGILGLIGYGAWRALRSDGWDQSNLLNWLRLLSHVFIHPGDFAKMYYVYFDENETIYDYEKAFSYLDKDEFEGVVKSRPK